MKQKIIKIFSFIFFFIFFILLTMSILKINLTLNAKKDIQKINNLIQKKSLLQKPVTPIKNFFEGEIVIFKNNNIVTVNSNNIPYQACLTYGLSYAEFDKIYINNIKIYSTGEFPSRDNILKYCMLNEKHAIIKLIKNL